MNRRLEDLGERPAEARNAEGAPERPLDPR
jgi:hypothetical protein